MIKWLESDNRDEYEDLPWAKEWIKTSGDPDSTHEVLSGFITDKGLLLQTGEFKVFLFKNSQDYKMVLEALKVWIDDALYVHPLVIQVKTKGKCCFGIDDERPKVIWREDDNRIDSVREEAPIKHKSNPLLQATVPTIPAIVQGEDKKALATPPEKSNGRRPAKATSPSNPA